MVVARVQFYKRRQHQLMWRGGWMAMMLGMAAASVAADDSLFEQRIRPVLVGTCFKCHGGEKTNGKLRVDSRAALVMGGENGAAIVPGAPEKSLLMRALERADDVSAMPPDKRLPAETIAAFATWIKAGAHWPEGPTARAGFEYRRHWAFEPVRRVAPPAGALPSGSSVDAFLNAKWAEQGLKPAARANRRTLLRRVTFDLIGLPPTPEEMSSFLADESPRAWSLVVERLLASPQYGERWGRHWLDVVRYADTAGETADYPVPHAWRYRNYVIDSFNRDRPYNEFIREQIAGDIMAQQLSPEAPPERYAELVTATGYLAIARRFGFDTTKDHYLTLEDTIDTLGKSVLGLTVGCARCHSHKYDPITTEDYYALYGIFESTRFPLPGCEKIQRPKDFVPMVSLAEMERRQKPHREQLAALEGAQQQAEKALAEVMPRVKAAFANPTVLAEGEFANGGQQEIKAGLKPTGDTCAVAPGQLVLLTVLPKANHGADSTGVEFELSEVEGRNRRWNLVADTLENVLAGNPHADGQGNAGTWCFLNLQEGPALFQQKLPNFEGRQGLSAWGNATTPWLGVNATAETVKFSTVTLGPRSFFAHPSAQGGVAVGWMSPFAGRVKFAGKLLDADATGGDGIAWTVSTVAPEAARELLAARETLAAVESARARKAQWAAQAPAVPVAYAVSEGEPHHAKLHKRGDPEQLGAEVPRRYIEFLGGQAVPPNSGSGRLALATWLTDERNPLTARVMVNRIWQHHFGVGIVSTPNDFGTRGAAPSDPELLDWLAAQFMASGWSVKAMHRLMVLSEAYQRAAAETPVASGVAVDAARVYFPMRRLSAEEIRDAMLMVSGDLDTTPGGPHPFPAESTWGFTQHAPFTAVYETPRRSVYLMVQRIKRHPFLALFDGPDPAASTPDRSSTTVPTQALFFLNDAFVHARAKSLAGRLAALPDDAGRLSRACELLYGRAAEASDEATCQAFLASYAAALPGGSPGERREAAWAAWVRMMLGSNEFLYVM